MGYKLLIYTIVYKINLDMPLIVVVKSMKINKFYQISH